MFSFPHVSIFACFHFQMLSFPHVHFRVFSFAHVFSSTRFNFRMFSRYPLSAFYFFRYMFVNVVVSFPFVVFDVGFAVCCAARVARKSTTKHDEWHRRQRATATMTNAMNNHNNNNKNNNNINAPRARNCRHRMRDMRKTWSMARQQRTSVISAGPHVTGLALYFYIQTPETCF